MKKVSILMMMLCLCTLFGYARKITLSEVAAGTYRSEGIYGIKPMQDGEHYTQISRDGKKIVKYSFKTGEEVATVFDVETARDCKLKSFDDYILSPDETKILIQTQTQQIYRHSFTAV